MKTNSLLGIGISLALISFCISCSNSSKEVKISATAIDCSLESIKIDSYDVLSLTPITIAEKKFDSTKTAFLELSITEPSFAYAEIGDQWATLYLEPGYDLKINVDAKNKGITFSGKGAEANNYLSQTLDIYKKYESKGGRFLWELTPSEFVLRLDSLQESLSNYHSVYCDSTGMPENISQLLELNNSLKLTSVKQNYLLGNPIDTSSSLSYDHFTNIIKEVPLDESLLHYKMLNYGMVLQWHLELDVYKPLWNEHKGLNQSDELMPILASDNITENEHYTPEIKEFLLAKNIDYQLESIGLTPAIDSLFGNFKKTYPTSNYLSSIQKRADKWLVISPGKLAPDFTGTTIDGKQLSLKDLRGKIVYIDVWATWCGPCIKEFPFSKKLQKLFEQDDEVVFLYVSIDNDKEAWEKKILADKSFKGIHIIQQDGQIRNSYLINGVPRYILIDSEGKIVKSEAPKPSSGKVENEIHELLKKMRS